MVIERVWLLIGCGIEGVCSYGTFKFRCGDDVFESP